MEQSGLLSSSFIWSVMLPEHSTDQSVSQYYVVVLLSLSAAEQGYQKAWLCSKWIGFSAAESKLVPFYKDRHFFSVCDGFI